MRFLFVKLYISSDTCNSNQKETLPDKTGRVSFLKTIKLFLFNTGKLDNEFRVSNSSDFCQA